MLTNHENYLRVLENSERNVKKSSRKIWKIIVKIKERFAKKFE